MSKGDLRQDEASILSCVKFIHVLGVDKHTRITEQLRKS